MSAAFVDGGFNLVGAGVSDSPCFRSTQQDGLNVGTLYRGLGFDGSCRRSPHVAKDRKSAVSFPDSCFNALICTSRYTDFVYEVEQFVKIFHFSCLSFGLYWLLLFVVAGTYDVAPALFFSVPFPPSRLNYPPPQPSTHPHPHLSPPFFFPTCHPPPPSLCLSLSLSLSLSLLPPSLPTSPLSLTDTHTHTLLYVCDGPWLRLNRAKHCRLLFAPAPSCVCKHVQVSHDTVSTWARMHHRVIGNFGSEADV